MVINEQNLHLNTHFRKFTLWKISSTYKKNVTCFSWMITIKLNWSEELSHLLKGPGHSFVCMHNNQHVVVSCWFTAEGTTWWRKQLDLALKTCNRKNEINLALHWALKMLIQKYVASLFLSIWKWNILKWNHRINVDIYEKWNIHVKTHFRKLNWINGKKQASLFNREI